VRKFSCSVKGDKSGREYPYYAETASKARYRMLLSLWEAFGRKSFTFKDVPVRVAERLQCTGTKTSL
jgi:hypothetical protein